MNFLDDLHRLVPKPCYYRPFVCDGLPESCDIVVIGENPATEMHVDWWSFWDDWSGCDLRKFEEAYATMRRKCAKRPVSNTRFRLRRLRDKGLRCLETNIFNNERPDGHGSDAVKNDLLDVLINSVPHLKGVIVHGVVARERLEYTDLLAGRTVCYLRHLRNESYEEIDRVCKMVRLS